MQKRRHLEINLQDFCRIKIISLQPYRLKDISNIKVVQVLSFPKLGYFEIDGSALFLGIAGFQNTRIMSKMNRYISSLESTITSQNEKNTPIKKKYIQAYPLYSTSTPLLASTLIHIYLGVIMIRTSFLKLHIFLCLSSCQKTLPQVQNSLKTFTGAFDK